MDSAELVRLLQHESRPLVESHYAELRTNLGTSHYHRLSSEELFRRGQAVLHHLTNWLTSRDEAGVRAAGEDLGRRRFAEGIPLGQVVLALILEEDHLLAFAAARKPPAGDDLTRQVTEFFGRLIHSTAHGYEQSLSVSNQHARRGAMPMASAVPAAPGPDNKGMEVSRGGQVGEQAG